MKKSNNLDEVGKQKLADIDKTVDNLIRYGFKQEKWNTVTEFFRKNLNKFL